MYIFVYELPYLSLGNFLLEYFNFTNFMIPEKIKKITNLCNISHK